MTEVEPRLKPDPVPCPCGCGKVGMPRVRAWADGLCHVKACACRRCTGGRQTGRARKREQRIATAIGGTREALSGALSGVDVRNGVIEIEETADLDITKSLRRWWESKGVSAKRARLWARRSHSDAARALVLSWDGHPRLLVMEWEDAARLISQAQYETSRED